jgi:hypothetical protein
LAATKTPIPNSELWIPNGGRRVIFAACEQRRMFTDARDAHATSLLGFVSQIDAAEWHPFKHKDPGCSNLDGNEGQYLLSCSFSAA